ncbi:MAG TPA: GIY-YIG nuclease family protein [Agriterribacter sp.]|nr:GIY-YIG nuclease family protein [Agriterribacter sp.]
MFFVYVIRSKKDGRFYVGLSEEVERRLKEHNSGKTKSTKGYVPWELCFYEQYFTRIEARRREIYLKSGIGKEFIKSYWTGSSVG